MGYSAVINLCRNFKPRVLLAAKNYYLLPIKLRELSNNTEMATDAKEEYNELLKPLSWLFGKWTSEGGKVQYPTMTDLDYGESAEFSPVGMKPVIEYACKSWKVTDKTPIHNEMGFIRPGPKPNQVSFVISHMIGVVEIQEGKVGDQTLTVGSTELCNDSFYKLSVVKKLIRTMTRKGDQLEQVVGMETVNTEMTEHLRITYDKVAQ